MPTSELKNKLVAILGFGQEGQSKAPGISDSEQ
jgi:ketol-acid reductoisomerase